METRRSRCHNRLIAAVRRVSDAKELVERQRARIEILKTNDLPTEQAEALLKTYIRTLALLEEQERGLRARTLSPNW